MARRGRNMLWTNRIKITKKNSQLRLRVYLRDICVWNPVNRAIQQSKHTSPIISLDYQKWSRTCFSIFKSTNGIQKWIQVVSKVVILGSLPLAAVLFVMGAELEVHLIWYFDWNWVCQGPVSESELLPVLSTTLQDHAPANSITMIT
jgi:hypothetical protein